jgi:hypothetical protein
VTARSGGWTEACEPQNISSLQILSLIGICADSVTLKRLRSNLLQHSTMATAMIQIQASYTEDTRNLGLIAASFAARAKVAE